MFKHSTFFFPFHFCTRAMVCTRAMEFKLHSISHDSLIFTTARYHSFSFSVALTGSHSNLHTRTLSTRFVSPPHIGLMLCLSIFLSLFRTKAILFPQLHSFMQTQDSALSKLLLKFNLDSAENQPLLNRLGVTCVKVTHKYPTHAHAR